MNSFQIIFTLLSPEDFLLGIEKGFDSRESVQTFQKNYRKNVDGKTLFYRIDVNNF